MRRTTSRARGRRRPRARDRAGRFGRPGAAGGAGDADPGRAGGVRAARHVRPAVRRDRADRRPLADRGTAAGQPRAPARAGNADATGGDRAVSARSSTPSLPPRAAAISRRCSQCSIPMWCSGPIRRRCASARPARSAARRPSPTLSWTRPASAGRTRRWRHGRRGCAKRPVAAGAQPHHCQWQDRRHRCGRRSRTPRATRPSACSTTDQAHRADAAVQMVSAAAIRPIVHHARHFVERGKHAGVFEIVDEEIALGIRSAPMGRDLARCRLSPARKLGEPRRFRHQICHISRSEGADWPVADRLSKTISRLRPTTARC